MLAIKLTLLWVTIVAQTLAFPDLIEQLTANGATQLVSLIDAAGLTDTLKSTGPYTIFAPVDAAFSKIPAADLNALKNDLQALKDTLLYHVVNGELFTFDLRSREHVASLNNHQIRIYNTNGHTYFNQALATKEEIQASNGVIYLIDEVLNTPEGTVWQILNNPDYNLTMFANTVKHAREDTRLNSTTSTIRYTVFAPTNEAFNNLPSTLLNRIQTSYARYIADYHTHRGTIHASSLGKDGSVTTMFTGHLIHVTHDPDTQEPLLNKLGHIVIQDIEADNGVVHVISHVLIPSTLAGIIG
ncbi:hypothetical protein ACF0H5_010287 [Mactra antiquata]